MATVEQNIRAFERAEIAAARQSKAARIDNLMKSLDEHIMDAVEDCFEADYLADKEALDRAKKDLARLERHSQHLKQMRDAHA